jgi:predicted DNA-binding protein (UPF0251 family)
MIVYNEHIIIFVENYEHMPRKKCPRNINSEPSITYFKPIAIPLCDLECVFIHLDEYEAIRLADYEKMYHAQAAKQMNISRQTFGRIIESARMKISIALIDGKAIKIEKTL